MLTKIVLNVAVKAVDMAANGKASVSFNIAGAPKLWTLAPWESSQASGSTMLSKKILSVSTKVSAKTTCTDFTNHYSIGSISSPKNIINLDYIHRMEVRIRKSNTGITGGKGIHSLSS